MRERSQIRKPRFGNAQLLATPLIFGFGVYQVHRLPVNAAMIPPPKIAKFGAVAKLSRDKLIHPEAAALYGGIVSDAPVLVILPAGKGTPFGQARSQPCSKN